VLLLIDIFTQFLRMQTFEKSIVQTESQAAWWPCSGTATAQAETRTGSVEPDRQALLAVAAAHLLFPRSCHSSAKCFPLTTAVFECVQQLSRGNISLKSDSCEEREGVQRRQPAMLVYPALQSPFSFLLEQWPFLNRVIKQLETPSGRYFSQKSACVKIA
jgi:hypothetical protein